MTYEEALQRATRALRATGTAHVGMVSWICEAERLDAARLMGDLLLLPGMTRDGDWLVYKRRDDRLAHKRPAEDMPLNQEQDPYYS